jgi:dTDP-4-amino-4,6-dideoxygalactose transaminase
VDPAVLGADSQIFKARLAELGVTNIPHFAPLYHFNLFHQLGYDQAEMAASCPVAEEAFAHRFTHLPLYPLTEGQVTQMGDLVEQAARTL